MGLQLDGEITVAHSGKVFVTLSEGEGPPVNLIFPNLADFLARVPLENQPEAQRFFSRLSRRLKGDDDRPLVLPHNGSLSDSAFSPPYCPLVYRDGMTLEEVREAYDLCRSSLGPTPLREWREDEDASHVRGAWVVRADDIPKILAVRDPVGRKRLASELAVEHITPALASSGLSGP